MVDFASWCGWRLGMIAHLPWVDVDLQGLEITLPDTKNGSPLTVPITPEMEAVLRRRWEAPTWKNADEVEHTSDYVFHLRGVPRYEINERFKRAAEKAGIPEVHFHDLRRVAARDLIRAGHHHTIVMSVLGHKTDAMFRRYAIVDTTDMRKALEGLAIYREKLRQEEIETAKNVTPF